MRGAEAIQEAREAARQRQNNTAFKNYFYLLDNNETAIVRFLEEYDELVSAYVHHVMVPRFKMPYKLVCRDQDPVTGASIGEDCPGCEDNDPQISKKRIQGAVNLIWRNGPVYELDGNGKPIKDNRDRKVVASRRDQIAVWTSGVTVFDNLITLGLKYSGKGGLTGRDWEVTRRGVDRETTYDFAPAEIDGGPVPLSKEDKELAATKYDLTEFETPAPYEDFWGKLAGFRQPSQQTTRRSFDRQRVATDVSPFLNTDE